MCFKQKPPWCLIRGSNFILGHLTAELPWYAASCSWNCDFSHLQFDTFRIPVITRGGGDPYLTALINNSCLITMSLYSGRLVLIGRLCRYESIRDSDWRRHPHNPGETATAWDGSNIFVWPSELLVAVYVITLFRTFLTWVVCTYGVHVTLQPVM